MKERANEVNNDVTQDVEGTAVLVNTATGEMITEPVIGKGVIDIFKSPATDFYCSIQPKTRSEKIKVYNAINSASCHLSDLGKEDIIEAVDVVAHRIVLQDMNTKEDKECARVVIIDKDGKTYEAVSEGIVSSLAKIFTIVGVPTWEEPVKMKLTKVRTRNSFMVNTLVLVD